MKRKRKVFYPPSRSSRGSAPTGGPLSFVSSTVVAVDPNARIGRKDIFAGMRVTILGTGLYAGETAVVARMISGGIPAALVRTEAGGMRRVRTIDLQPVASRKPEAPAAERAADLEPAG